MPENTAGGAKSPTKETSPTDDKSTAKKEIFTKRAKISDDFKYGILPYQDKSGADLKRSVIGGFKVKRIEDERTGACEITVTITTIKGEGAKDRTPKLPGLEKNYDPRKINRFPLTADLLRTKMIDLPKKMEWYEGWNWCASVMNFEEEELCANPTNFTIKVTGREEECVKRTMFKLLFYVIQRKCRPCPGWNMEDDDIVACILPDESTEFEGITICIIRGFRFEERLTDEEKRTMQSPPEECIAKSKKVMMTWQPSKARSILKAPPAMGRAELKELLLNVGSIVNRVDEIPDDCSPQRRRQLELKIQKQMAVLKARPPRKIDEGPMYIQMKQNPDTFELFIMSNIDKVTEEFEYTTIKTQIAQSTHKAIENHQADGQNAFFWISIGVIGSLFLITLTVFSFNLGLLQGIEYNGSTTICDSVQNEVDPRGIQDGTMVFDNLRRHDNRPPSLRSVSS